MDSNLLLWQPHDLIRAYLENGVQIRYFTTIATAPTQQHASKPSVYTAFFFFLYRIPTLPCGKVGDKDGFLFETETQKRASYYHAIDSLGLLTQDGCPLSYDRWLDSTFCLPFRLSHELNTYTPQQADRILQEPAVPLARSRLFLAFKKSTTYVVR